MPGDPAASFRAAVGAAWVPVPPWMKPPHPLKRIPYAKRRIDSLHGAGSASLALGKGDRREGAICAASSEISASPKREAASPSPAAPSSDAPGARGYPRGEIKTRPSEKGGSATRPPLRAPAQSGGLSQHPVPPAQAMEGGQEHPTTAAPQAWGELLPRRKGRKGTRATQPGGEMGNGSLKPSFDHCKQSLPALRRRTKPPATPR